MVYVIVNLKVQQFCTFSSDLWTGHLTSFFGLFFQLKAEQLAKLLLAINYQCSLFQNLLFIRIFFVSGIFPSSIQSSIKHVLFICFFTSATNFMRSLRIFSHFRYTDPTSSISQAQDGDLETYFKGNLILLIFIKHVW